MSLKNLQDVLDLVIPMGMIFEKAMEDGEFNPIRDGAKFISAIKYVGPAFKDAALIKSELESASDAEWDLFLQSNKKKFDLKDDNLEANVELAIEVGIQIAKFLFSFSAPKAAQV